ncbi:MAG TPA: hypothetical protein VM010_08210 [Chitinophagaceae bacterium]|nr:hypothetical protein [Chitinophagaceae bacterium]
MKFLYTFFLLFPIALAAQDCGLKTEKDQFTQQERLTTGFIPLTNAKISITADDKDIDFFIMAASDKCFDEASTASVVFDDGRTKANFRNSGSMNCEGLYHFTIRNTTTPNTNLQRMATKKIKAIVLTNGKIVTSILLNEAQQQQVLTAAACMAKEANTLLKKS